MISDKYFKTYRLQESTPQPSGYPPPWDIIWVFGDGRAIQGLFVYNQSSEVLVATNKQEQTEGSFITLDTELMHNHVLRDISTSTTFRLIGDVVAPPSHFKGQYRRFRAIVIDRGEDE